MGKKLKLGLVATVAVMFTAACDLDVTNPNQPDRERALAAPDDVEGLIGSSYGQYHRTAQIVNDGLGAQMEVTSDHNTLSWGNHGSRDISEEPRKPYNNSPSFTYSYASEEHWSRNYSAISAASDGLRAIASGLEIGPGGERNARAAAFATFVQGVAHCLLGASYDQAFLIDENTDFEQELAPVPYDQVVDFGVQKLEAAAGMAAGMGRNLDVSWINGNALSPAGFQRLIRSHLARCKTNMPRSVGEREGLNWGSILGDIAAGIQEDFIIQGNEAGVDPWWDGLKPWYTSDPGWNRTDLAHLGQADVSGAYQDWVGSPSADRLPFNVITPDQRVPEPVSGARGVYYQYFESTLLPPARGNYHLSNYVDMRWEEYTTSCDACWMGPFPVMTLREMRLLEAEGAMDMGDAGTVAAIVNETRVANGGLTPVAGAGPVPAEPDGSCVPHKRFSTSDACGDLRDAMQYERYMEVGTVTAGDTYFFARRQGELQTGTVLHWPIPGAELETLQMDIYTFGGAGNPGSAPVIVPAVPGDLNSALERVSYAIEAMERLESRDSGLEWRLQKPR